MTIAEPPRGVSRRPVAAKRSPVPAGVPLHVQVFTKLRDAIFRGDFPVGSRLAGELALGAEFDVSRITVRRALDELAARGLVRREQGRGTLVCARPAFSPVVADVNGLLERNVRIGLETESRLEEFGYVPAPADVAQALRMRQGARVQMAVRIRTRDGLPFAHVTSWIPERFGRQFDATELEQRPVLDLLEQHGIVVDNIEQTISAAAASRAVARALAVDPGAPLLKVERVVYAADGAAVEKSQAFYPAGGHQYRITLRRAHPRKRSTAPRRA